MALITGDHVRDLEAAAPGSALVIVDGRAKITSGTDAAEGYLVVGREDLRGMLGTDPPDAHVYDEIARRLDSAVVEMGG